MGEAQETNWRIENGDGQAIQYPDNTFDVVFSLDVFEHVPSPEKCLAEIKRVLVPGGVFITSFAPIWTGIVGHHCEHWVADTVKIIPPWGHLIYTYDEMLQHLQKEVNPARAKDLCDMIYNNGIINRVGIKRFEAAFSNCGLRMLEKKRVFQSNRFRYAGSIGEPENELTDEVLQKLKGQYTAEELLTIGYYMVVKK